ncbi:S1 family serine peptidase [Kitasatospora sp. NPDC001119]
MGSTLRARCARFTVVVGAAALAVAVQAGPAAAIEGGASAQLDEFPWMALLNYTTSSGNSFRCGGSLIGNRYVVTASHCLRNAQGSTVRLGSTRLDSGGTTVGVSRVVTYPGFDPSTMDNDIAVLQLATPVPAGVAAPVALPSQGSDPAAGTTAELSGWGATSPLSAAPSPDLLHSAVAVESRTLCQSENAGHPVGLDQLCAERPGESACEGDGGDPLVAGGVLLGIQSFHRDAFLLDPGHCRAATSPDVYTNVGQYTDWINSVVSAG